jgi:hypothetical protein
VTFTVPETLAPLAGAVTLTAGGVVSGGGALETVTVTVADVAVLPAASHAWAVSVCVPFATVVLFQEAVYGAEVSAAPRAVPSR